MTEISLSTTAPHSDSLYCQLHPPQLVSWCCCGPFQFNVSAVSFDLHLILIHFAVIDCSGILSGTPQWILWTCHIRLLLSVAESHGLLSLMILAVLVRCLMRWLSIEHSDVSLMSRAKGWRMKPAEVTLHCQDAISRVHFNYLTYGCL